MKSCCVIGLGYIGLPTSALLCSNGYKVTGVDVNQSIVNKINSGEIHIHEPGLLEIVKSNIDAKNFVASLKILKSEIFIICVPTPLYSNPEKNIPEPNLDYVYQAARSIAKVIEKDNLIILESTSPVGTTKKIADVIEKVSGIRKEDFFLAYCPERVIPGNILKELIYNDRVVGGINQLSSLKCKKFYESFCKGNVYMTDSSTAELVKLSENSYRDLNIAFANELSIICNEYKIKVDELIKLANKHPRVNIHNPGCGVGGHCIAVDPWFIASQLPDQSQLIQKSRHVNLEKTGWVINNIEEKILQIKSLIKREPKIAFLGLTYKANSDDLRESPALKIVDYFIKKGEKCYVCEPFIEKHKEIILHSLSEVIDIADIIFFLVAHDQFKIIDLNGKAFEDYCGIF